MHLFKFVCLTVVLASSLSTGASVVMPNDGPYYRLRKGQTLYIYDESTRHLMEDLIAHNEAVRAMYNQSFGWLLDEEMDLVLTSPRQQIANAYATVVPNIKTVWFPAGAAVSEEMAESSWLRLLNAHEVSHLYQLNAKGTLNSKLKSVVGNSIYLYPFVWPVFIHPNIFTPTFLIEGNATFNESRLNLGGRLYSGEKRALVLAQIGAGDIDPTRLINDEFRFPFGEEPYMQGAYFQAHLAAKHGVEKTNQFFVAQGHHYLWPFILNKTFRDHFGDSYPQEIREYVRGLQGLAAQQKATNGISVLDATYVMSMNHDHDRIFFLSTDGKKLPVLNIFDKKTKSLSSQSLDLIGGKVFWDGTTPKTASANQHDLTHLEYSLYGESARFDPRYRGQIVTDQRAGNTVALDASNSWTDSRLLLNGEPYDIAHSHAILDNKGNIYYFRQNGAERLIFRNREPLAKFEGFYSKPMEVTDDGTFYFIGSTDFGSTLYQLRGKEISRVLKSDRVVDARRIDENHFLVTEVNHLGHNVTIAKAEISAQLPAVYSYGFPNKNLIPEKTALQEGETNTEKAYSALREMRYSSLNVSTEYQSGSGFGLSTVASFTDPLEYQGFSIGYSGYQFNDRQAFVEYDFTKYIPDFFARYVFEDDKWKDRLSRERWSYNHEVDLGARVPVFRWQRWDAAVELALIYKNDEQRTTTPVSPNRYETYGTRSKANVEYSVNPSLGFYPWRYFSFTFENRLESQMNGFAKEHNTSAVRSSYIRGFPAEIYGTVSANYAWAETHDIIVGPGVTEFSSDIRIPRLTSHNDDYEVKNAGSLRLEVSKVLTIPGYSARIPIGLRRLAPLVVAQGLFMDSSNRYPPSTFEWGYGADLELLLGHKAPVHFRFLQAFDTRYPDHPDEQASLNFSHQF